MELRMVRCGKHLSVGVDDLTAVPCACDDEVTQDDDLPILQSAFGRHFMLILRLPLASTKIKPAGSGAMKKSGEGLCRLQT